MEMANIKMAKHTINQMIGMEFHISKNIQLAA
jgi:hypothetical protein